RGHPHQGDLACAATGISATQLIPAAPPIGRPHPRCCRAPGRLPGGLTRSVAPSYRQRIYFRADLHSAFADSPHAEDIVSKQDTHFFNTFSLVIGLLVAIAIGIFAFARVVASQTQDKDVYEETQYLKTVRQNLAPVAQVAVAGQDNAALAIKPDTSAAGSAGAGPALPTTGEGLFMQ